MNQDRIDSFELHFASDFPEYDRELLLTTMSQLKGVTLQKLSDEERKTRFVGIDDYIVIVTAIGATAGAVTSIIELIKELNSIIKEKGLEPKAKLQRSQQKTLDLNTATEEEIKKWLEQK